MSHAFLKSLIGQYLSVRSKRDEAHANFASSSSTLLAQRVALSAAFSKALPHFIVFLVSWARVSSMHTLIFSPSFRHAFFDFLVVVMNSSSSSSQKAADGRYREEQHAWSVYICCGQEIGLEIQPSASERRIQMCVQIRQIASASKWSWCCEGWEKGIAPFRKGCYIMWKSRCQAQSWIYTS